MRKAPGSSPLAMPAPSHIGQRGRVQQAEVRALPGERMHHVRRISDQGHAFGHIVFGRQTPQRKLQALAGEARRAERTIEILLELAFEILR